MKIRTIREVIFEILEKNGGDADFDTIYSYVFSKKNVIRLEAKDTRKTVRGVISKMKKNGLVSKSENFFRLTKQ